MPIVIIIINNGGIYMGMEAASTTGMQERIATTPVTSLSSATSARYELMAEAFGGKGFYVTQPHEVQPAVAAALKLNTPSIINIIINSSAGRRPQEFDWLTRKSAL
jgi:thiamine pyrophosphate-dependent acetolactate synthase large subunit-like protein